MSKFDASEDPMRGARCWLAGLLFTSCLIGSGEALAVPVAGEYLLDAGSELRICSATTGCGEPVSIAGARFDVDPGFYWVLGRLLSDGTYDLYEGNFESEWVWQLYEVINSPDIGPYASSDDSYLTFSSDTSFQWTGSFEGDLSCDSFGLDPSSEDCWSPESRDFELINVSATWVPEPDKAIQLGFGLLAVLAIRGVLRRRPGSGSHRDRLWRGDARHNLSRGGGSMRAT